MNLKKGDFIELWVEKTAYGGEGIAYLDGLVIFVKGAIPGDRVLVKLIKKKKDYAHAIVVNLIEPSIHRIEAPCSYFGYCGGCQWQHTGYDRQLAFKKEHIKEAMVHIGAISDVLVHNPIPSAPIFGYRNKMEFSFSDRPWLLPDEFEKGKDNNDFALGLHVPGTFHKVIDIDACLIQHDQGNRILRHVKQFVKESNFPVYGLKSHKGFWRFLMLRYSRAFDEWMVNIVTSQEKIEGLKPLAKSLCATFDNIKTIVNNINTKKAGITLGEKEIILEGEGFIQDKIGPYRFQISANSFFQTNTTGAERLYQTVVKYAELTGTETVLDLYSGTGIIPIFLSDQAKEVIGMEISESAVINANNNCEQNNIQNCRFIHGDIREKMSDLNRKPNILVIDPPRAGMHKDVLAGVLELAPKKIVYVSCNPATMARDMGLMSEKYHILEIQPVDMFPHTYHIESVARMARRQ